MATQIANINSQKLSLRWQSPYQTGDINRKTGATVPRGIVRGFTPTIAGGILTLSPDPLTQDSAMVLRQNNDTDEYGITYRESGTLQVTIPSMPVTGTIFIGVVGSYTSSSTTTAVWKYFTRTEYEAGDTDVAVIVCSYNIDQDIVEYWSRDCGWMWNTRSSTGWTSVINTDFNKTSAWRLDATDVDTTDHVDIESTYLNFEQSAGLTGGNALYVDFSNLYIGTIKHLETFTVSPGERLVGSFWINKNSNYTNGSISNIGDITKNVICYGLEYYDENDAIVSTVYLAANGEETHSIASITDDEWILITGEFNSQSGVYNIVPATTSYARAFIRFLRQDGTVASTAGTCYIDNPQIFIVPVDSSAKNWKECSNRTKTCVVETTKHVIKNNVFDDTLLDFEVSNKSDGAMYILQPNGSLDVNAKMYIGSAETTRIDTTIFGTLEAEVLDVTGSAEVGPLVVNGTITAGSQITSDTQILAPVFRLSSPYAFTKTYRWQSWIANALQNYTSATSSTLAKSSGTPITIGIPEAGAKTTVFYIPVGLPIGTVLTSIGIYGYATAATSSSVKAELVTIESLTDTVSLVASTTCTLTAGDSGDPSTPALATQDIDVTLQAYTNKQYFYRITVIDETSAHDAGLTAIMVTGEVDYVHKQIHV